MKMKFRFDIMRKIKFWSMLMLMGMLIPLAVSCGGDDDGDGGGSTDGDLIAKAVGTWMCTQSTDTQQGQSYQGLMVGKEVTINANGTYTSTASTFGYTGTYTVSGNKITPRILLQEIFNGALKVLHSKEGLTIPYIKERALDSIRMVSVKDFTQWKQHGV